MARPREFDVDEALAQAMDVFWAKGYQGSSLNDLLDAMHIARGSLYKAFKDKHSIYLAALDLYDRTVIQDAIDTLHTPKEKNPIKRIEHILLSVSETLDRRGCLVCNAAVDQAPFDRDVQAKVLAMSKRFECAIEETLAQSDIGKNWTAQKTRRIARQINTAYMGLRVLTKAGYPPEELADIAHDTMKMLQQN